MGGHLLMSEKERKRKGVFERVRTGTLSVVEGAEVLGLSYRQCRRSYKRYREEGDEGLVHRGRGRPSNRRKEEGFKKGVLKRYEERYGPVEMGPVLASEKLKEDGLEVGRETLRLWLLGAGLWRKRRKRAKHRSRRERKGHFGELVQMDGSHHRWFGGDQAEACLMEMVDDATGKTMALMAEEETTELAMRLLWAWIERYGVPKALYTDKKTVFMTDREPTLEEELAGQEPKTAFGRACEKLGIQIIAAHSPQAKGRVERKHGVFQDRFAKELKLRGIRQIPTANKLLLNGFVHNLNEKFAVKAVHPEDYHQPLSGQLALADVFSFEETRVVQKDWTLRFKNHHYQILEDNLPLPKPADRVLVRVRLDGSLHLLYKNQALKYRTVSIEQLGRRHDIKSKPQASPGSCPDPQPSSSPRPAANHPWRTSYKRLKSTR